MSGFREGDVVVCVDDSPCTVEGGEQVIPCPWQKGDVGRVVSIYLHGIELTPNKASFQYVAARRFRKLPKADDSFVAQIRACCPHDADIPAPVFA